MRNPENEDLTSPCEPEARVDNKPIVPCGLVAWSLFNDTYGFSVSGMNLSVNKKDIAWDSDKNYKFGSKVYPKNFQQGSLIGGGKLDEKIPVSAVISSLYLFSISLSKSLPFTFSCLPIQAFVYSAQFIAL